MKNNAKRLPVAGASADRPKACAIGNSGPDLCVAFRQRRPTVPAVKIITRLAFAAALSLAAVLVIGVSAGRASTDGNAPWCAVVNQGAGNVMWECYYQTIAECRPNVLAGNRGFCQHNPYYQGGPGPSRHHRYRSYY